MLHLPGKPRVSGQGVSYAVLPWKDTAEAGAAIQGTSNTTTRGSDAPGILPQLAFSGLALRRKPVVFGAAL